MAQALSVLGDKGSIEGNAVLAAIPRAEAPALLRALIGQGIDIDEARWVGADLESVFMTETGSVQTPETIHAR
jgi:ABC-2 type transport system ATP-binding protein